MGKRATAPTVWFCLDCAGVADVDWSAPAPPGACGRDSLTRSPRAIVARLRRIRDEAARATVIRDCVDAGLIDEGGAYRASTSRSVDRFGMSQRRRLRALEWVGKAEAAAECMLRDAAALRQLLTSGNGTINGSSIEAARQQAQGVIGAAERAFSCASQARAEMRRG